MNVLEKILEEIKELKRKQNNQNQDYRTGYFGALSTVEGVIAGLNDGWIQVEERVPEEGKEVIAQFVVRVIHINGTVDEEVYIHPLYYENGVWKSFAGVPNGRVEAWQPLPEAYHPKQTPAAEHITSRFTRVD